jgi:hypothetical protein
MRLVDPARRNAAMGLWGAYMPTGTALALLFGPVMDRGTARLAGGGGCWRQYRC